MFRLALTDPAGPPMSVELSATPVYLGRAPTNDLVISDRSVSSRHAAVFTSGGKVFVEDLGSRNGTFVGDKRVRKIAEIRPDELLILGGTVRLRIDAVGPNEAASPLLVLEQLDGAVRVPLHHPSLRIGPDREADLWIPELPEPVELKVGPERAWLGAKPLGVGETFLIGARSFRLVRAAPVLSLTLDPEPDAPPYKLWVELSGPTGPRARLEDPRGDARIEWAAPNRVVLLYLLARKLAADLEAGLGPGERGWCGDAEVATGVWGRDGIDRSLNVLVTRIRNDLRRAGLDPWVLEKRQGHLRVRVGVVEVER